VPCPAESAARAALLRSYLAPTHRPSPNAQTSGILHAPVFACCAQPLPLRQCHVSESCANARMEGRRWYSLSFRARVLPVGSRNKVHIWSTNDYFCVATTFPARNEITCLLARTILPHGQCLCPSPCRMRTMRISFQCPTTAQPGEGALMPPTSRLHQLHRTPTTEEGGSMCPSRQLDLRAARCKRHAQTPGEPRPVSRAELRP
jgi:hypothetical protein